MISVVISAYNEEKNIEACIDSVRELASEVIVIDNESTDKTAAIARRMGAKVFTQENNPHKIDLQKNFGFEKAREDWVLSLDADERLTPQGTREILDEVSKDTKTAGYFIPRKNIIFGKWIKNSIWWPDYQLKLFRRGKGKFLSATVHLPISIKGETRHLAEPIVHHNYESISQFVNRMNNIYTEIEADQIISSGKKLSFMEAVKMPASDFLKTYFAQNGYKDGLHGLILSMLQAFYMFLVFAKVWERQGFYERDQKEVLKGVKREFYENIFQGKFWLFTVLGRDTRNPVKKGIYLFSKKFLK